MRGSRGTFGTTRHKHGHTIHFESGRGYAYIDVSYDGREAIDVINVYDYATGTSDLTRPRDFEKHVREYLDELTKHDADGYAEASRY